MGNAVKINFKELENFSKQLEKLAEETRWVIAELTNEIAARLLRKVIKRTPVGKYGEEKVVGQKKVYRYEEIEGKKTKTGKTKRKRIDTGKTKNIIKKMSTIKKKNAETGKWEDTEEVAKVGGTLRRGWEVGPVNKNGETYTVEVFNSVEYASYVEYGHRQTPGKFVPQIGKKLKKSWVQGQFMLTISEKELSENLNVIIEKKLTELFREWFR